MELQVEQHDAFQRREWQIQRTGWVLMGLIVVAALLGLLGGPGPLSWTTATSDDGLVAVEYQRFTHHEADDLVTVTLAPEAVTTDSVDVELAGSWVQAMDITGIRPQPSEEVVTAYGLRLTFATEPGAALSAEITLRPGAYGDVDGGVRFEGTTVAFDQFVFP